MTAENEQIGTGRARIDQLDAQIIELIESRMRVSQGIQDARLRRGEPRIQHAREITVVQRYRHRLGDHGGSLALLLLEMARGPRRLAERSPL